MERKNKRIVILGAGLAGLRIGQILSAEGIEVDIIEEQSSIGGMLQTIQKSFQGQRYLFDLGPHLFFEEYAPIYHSTLRDGNEEGLNVICGNFVMKVADREFLYPLKIKNMLVHLPISFSFKIMRDLIGARFERKIHKEPLSVEDWMASRFGNTLFRTFFAPYIEKCTGLPYHRVSANWAKERTTVTGESLIETWIKRIGEHLKREKTPNLPSSDQMVAYYPTYGAGQISSTMAKLIERRGGKIRLNTKLLTIRLEQSMVKSVQVLENGNLERTLTGDRFISTIPITNLFQAISPGVPPEMIKMSQQLKYRHLLLLNLIIDRKDILNHFEIFYPDKRFPFKRIYEPKKMSKKMAPEKRSSLVLEICYSDEDQFDDEKEKKIVNESIRVLEDEGILKQEEVLDLFTIKLPTAYPIYELDYETKVEKLREFLSDIENLFSCGRQGLFWYYAMTNETMEIAEVVAEMILSGKHKHQIEKRGKWSRYFF